MKYKKKQDRLSAVNTCMLHNSMVLTLSSPAGQCKCMQIYNPTKFGFYKANRNKQAINICHMTCW